MVSTSFEKALDREFDGRLRVRWSVARGAWQVESRSHRPVAPTTPRNSLDDTAIRWVDGYDLVVEVARGDRVPCPNCGRETHIPVMQMKEARCAHCRRTFRACYWPLNDALLQALRRTDPNRGGYERIWAELEGAEDAREAARRRLRHNQTEAIWKDQFNRVFEIPQVGYTGRDMR